MKNTFLSLGNIMKFAVFASFTLFLNGSVLGQNKTERTTRGTDFWITFGQIAEIQDPSGAGGSYSAADLGIRIAATDTTVVTCSFTENHALDTTFVIPAGRLGPDSTFLLSGRRAAVYNTRPKSGATDASYGNTSFKSMRITTDKPVSVYSVSQVSGSGDATNIFPDSSLGTSYRHISYPSISIGGTSYEYARYDGYAVIATKNGTTVKENGVLKATLQAGQVYYLYSACNDDLTGSYIESNYPIAYFVINTGTRVPITSGSSENLYQQLVPINGWGRNFVVPVTRRGTERVRIMASQAGTKLTIQGTYTTISGNLNNMSAGSYAEINITSGCYIQSNFPVGVCSYLVGNGFLSEEIYTAGDPAMTWIPSVEQAVTSITIAPFNMPVARYSVFNNYAIIITPTNHKSQTTMTIPGDEPAPLNGGEWFDIASSNYSFYRMPIDNLEYSFANPYGLIALGYGYGGSKSYYYLAGAGTRSLNPHIRIDDDHYQDVQNKVFCNDSIDVRGIISSISDTATIWLRWFIDGTENVSLRNDTVWNVSELNLGAGDYTLQMVVINYQDHTDTCTYHFTIEPVIASISGATTICMNGTTTLAATPSGGTWESLNPAIATVNSSGVVTGEGPGNARFVYTANNCTDTTGYITVIEPVITTILADTLCLPSNDDPIEIQLSGTPPGGTWSSIGDNILTIEDSEVYIYLAGKVRFIYEVSGCADTTKEITVMESPIAEITGEEKLCVNTTVIFSGTPAGGSWTSSNPSAATVDNSGSVTAIADGVTVITYKVPPCSEVTLSVSVESAVASAAVASLCAGETTLLSGSPVGGTWESSDTTVATVNNSGVVTGKGNGTVYFSYTSADGCMANTGEIDVTNPVINNVLPDTLCLQGEEPLHILLSGTPLGGTWSSIGDHILTIEYSEVYIYLAGKVRFIYELNGCADTTKEITFIDSLAVAITGETTLCVGLTTTTLSGTPAGGHWTSLNPTVASVNSSGIVTALSPGTASFEYTIGECTETTGVITVEDCCPPGPVVYVNRNVDQEDEGDGSSWEKPLREIADALRLAKVCDAVTEVWVAQENYIPLYNALTGDADASRDVAFVVPDGVKMYGGFPPDANDNDNGPIGGILTKEEALETRNRDTYQTFMNGDLNGNDIDDNVTTRAENAYHVVKVEGSALIDGFYITGGHADGTAPDDNTGAGVWARIENPADTLILNNNVIEKNIAAGYIFTSTAPVGAGIKILGNAIITNNKIQKNRLFVDNNSGSSISGSGSLSGAGIYALVGNDMAIIIENNLVNNNTIQADRSTKDGYGTGAGIFGEINKGGILEINYNRIDSNEILLSGNVYTQAYGGGIYVNAEIGTDENATSVLISYNHINKNRITSHTLDMMGLKGGGVFIKLFSSARVSRMALRPSAITRSPGITVINNLIAGNSLNGFSPEGGGIYAEINHREGFNTYSKIAIVNNTVVSNSAPDGTGGGINLYRRSDNISTKRFDIHNNILWDNTATIADDIYGSSEEDEFFDAAFAVTHNLIGATVNTFPVANNNTIGTGSDNDPQFVDISNQDVSLNDYQLAPTSPAINTGRDTAYIMAGGHLSSNKDLADHDRKIDYAIDKGAYESRQYFFTLRGTVFPFVKTDDPSYDSLFVIRASLYEVPEGTTASKRLKALLASAPLYVDSLKNYDTTVYIPGTPKNPGDYMRTNNPGIPINWAAINKPSGGDADTTALLPKELPSKPIGYYTFARVPAGEYILEIARGGYLKRYAKISVSSDSTLGHREIIAGDVDGSFWINASDLSKLAAYLTVPYENARYNARFDLNGSKIIDEDDLEMMYFYLGATYNIYTDSYKWLSGK